MRIEIELKNYKFCNGCPCLHSAMIGATPVEARCAIKPEYHLRISNEELGFKILREDWCIRENGK